MRGLLRFRPLLATGLAAMTVAWSDEIALEEDPTPEVHVDALREGRHPRVRESLRGTAFPEGVLALTWDDGPDKRTLDLARFLRGRRISGTFFVVRAWEDGISEEPGRGSDRFSTGYGHLPVLGDLVGLGHRLGNHTDGHVILEGLALDRVVEQIGRNQTALDPFLSNELRIFRAPGGYWSAAASSALDEPSFAHTIGPFRWDIDEKDWSASVDGLSPRAVADRYLRTALRLKRGIVLFHDRVGRVGSSFALDLAKEVVPALEAKGFVFAPPLLAFTSFEARSSLVPALVSATSRISFGDLDGDGRADLCTESNDHLACARATTVARPAGALPRTAFSSATAARLPSGSSATAIADIDGDGRADLCFLRDDDVACERSLPGGRLAPLESWGSSLGAHGDAGAVLRLADIDGDGRADACVRDGEGVTCATSTAVSFGPARTWIDASTIDPTRIELADVDGDGRADACSAGVCALSTGRAFGAPVRWSSAKGLTLADEVRFGDLNGDGRADACIATADGIACAFSNGRAFTAPTVWLDRHISSFELADINGDGRADVCAVLDGHVHCGLAP